MVLWGNKRYQESLHETEQCLCKAPNFGGADTYRAMILIYAKGSDQQVVKIDGMVTTTMKDGQPNTTFKGKWVVVNAKGALAGIKGEGTYSGQFTAEDNNDVIGCMRSLRYKVGRQYVGG